MYERGDITFVCSRAFSGFVMPIKTLALGANEISVRVLHTRTVKE